MAGVAAKMEVAARRSSNKKKVVKLWFFTLYNTLLVFIINNYVKVKIKFKDRGNWGYFGLFRTIYTLFVFNFRAQQMSGATNLYNNCYRHTSY